MASSYVKDPDANLDYSVDWSQWLQSGETITASTWVVTTGITKGTTSNTTTSTTVWLSGGTDGTKYTATNHITTSLARQDDRSITIRVQQR